MPDRLDRRLHRSEGRHQDHADIGIPVFHLRQQLRAQHAFHAKVGQDHGIVFLTQPLKRVVTTADTRALMPATLQDIAQQAAHVGIIVDHQDRAPFLSHTAPSRAPLIGPVL
ncbi:hypothetical protein NSND_62437 [Nitrospira sp. ND1]|nr:hypothetical protein NSND_62437 [Nitrospira sp. ND1]